MDKLRFVGDWMVDEYSRVQHFVEMLPPEYRTMPRTATTLPQAFMMAKMAEMDVLESIRLREERFSQRRHTIGRSSDRLNTPSSSEFHGESGSNVRSEMSSQVMFSETGNEQRPKWCSRCIFAHE